MTATERKVYLSMVERRVRPGTGSAIDAVREHAAVFGMPPLRCLFGDVSFVIVGGLATRQYMPARLTLDADVLVLPGDLVRAEHALTVAGCRKQGTLAIGGSTWETPDGLAIDVVSLDAPWVAEAVERPVMTSDGQPCIDLPHLVLMKLFSSRVQDLADISRMLALADDGALASTRALVVRHRPADAEDLESLLRLGRLEHDKG